MTDRTFVAANEVCFFTRANYEGAHKSYWLFDGQGVKEYTLEGTLLDNSFRSALIGDDVVVQVWNKRIGEVTDDNSSSLYFRNRAELNASCSALRVTRVDSCPIHIRYQAPEPEDGSTAVIGFTDMDDDTIYIPADGRHHRLEVLKFDTMCSQMFNAEPDTIPAGASEPAKQDWKDDFFENRGYRIPAGTPDTALFNTIFEWDKAKKAAVVSHFDVTDGSAAEKALTITTDSRGQFTITHV